MGYQDTVNSSVDLEMIEQKLSFNDPVDRLGKVYLDFLYKF